MSWTGSVSIPKGTSYREAEKMVVEMPITGAGPHDDPAVHHAVRTARSCAINVLALAAVSGGQPVGNGEYPPLRHGIRVTLSGHANPEHEPRPGWSNDFIQLAVYQIDDSAPTG